MQAFCRKKEESCGTLKPNKTYSVSLARCLLWSSPTAASGCLCGACPNGHLWLGARGYWGATAKAGKSSSPQKNIVWAQCSPLKHSQSTISAIWMAGTNRVGTFLPLKRTSVSGWLALECWQGVWHVCKFPSAHSRSATFLAATRDYFFRRTKRWGELWLKNIYAEIYSDSV